jgi:hypothetical protein
MLWRVSSVQRIYLSRCQLLRGKVSKSQIEIKIQVNDMARISNLFFYLTFRVGRVALSV